jgi:hypothetical protein
LEFSRAVIVKERGGDDERKCRRLPGYSLQPAGTNLKKVPLLSVLRATQHEIACLL